MLKPSLVKYTQAGNNRVAETQCVCMGCEYYASDYYGHES